MPSVSYPAVVRRVLDVEAAHGGQPRAIGELSHAAGVSERTLRTAFHRVLGVSPKRYLMRHRLKEAREVLLRAGDAKGAVTRAATQCGFFELGRFAGAYRRLFGMRPSDTLRSTVCGERS